MLHRMEHPSYPLGCPHAPYPPDYSSDKLNLFKSAGMPPPTIWQVQSSHSNKISWASIGKQNTHPYQLQDYAERWSLRTQVKERLVITKFQLSTDTGMTRNRVNVKQQENSVISRRSERASRRKDNEDSIKGNMLEMREFDKEDLINKGPLFRDLTLGHYCKDGVFSH